MRTSFHTLAIPLTIAVPCNGYRDRFCRVLLCPMFQCLSLSVEAWLLEIYYIEGLLHIKSLHIKGYNP